MPSLVDLKKFLPLVPGLLLLVFPQLRLFSRQGLSYSLVEKSNPHSNLVKRNCLPDPPLTLHRFLRVQFGPLCIPLQK